LDQATIARKAAELAIITPGPPLVLSAVSGLGIAEALRAVVAEIDRSRAAQLTDASEPRQQWQP
jgi:hypothetical protein